MQSDAKNDGLEMEAKANQKVGLDSSVAGKHHSVCAGVIEAEGQGHCAGLLMCVYVVVVEPTVPDLAAYTCGFVVGVRGGSLEGAGRAHHVCPRLGNMAANDWRK